jgi:hypothetical protein
MKTMRARLEAKCAETRRLWGFGHDKRGAPKAIDRLLIDAILDELRELDEGMREAAVQALTDVTVDDPKAAAWDAVRAYRAMIDDIRQSGASIPSST